MKNKFVDRLYLAISLIAISPLIVATILVICIGYPLHCLKDFLLSRINLIR